jgi:hypothetical protein
LTLAIQIGVVVLIAAGLAALAVLVWALVRFVDTMDSVKRLADDTDRDLIPAIAKLDATLDAMNDEVGRVHHIVDQVRDVTETVTETKRAADRVVDETVVGLTRITRAVGTVFKNRGR